MRRLAFALASLMLLATAQADQPHVLAQLPEKDHKLGEIVEIPINIMAEEMEIVSYSVELRYDKSMLRLLDVRPGLTPMYSSQPQFNTGVAHGNDIWISGSALSFGVNQKIINVANLHFELIAEHSHPKIELAESGPLVRKDGFEVVAGTYTVEGEIGLYNYLFDDSFE